MVWYSVQNTNQNQSLDMSVPIFNPFPAVIVCFLLKSISLVRLRGYSIHSSMRRCRWICRAAKLQFCCSQSEKPPSTRQNCSSLNYLPGQWSKTITALQCSLSNRLAFFMNLSFQSESRQTRHLKQDLPCCFQLPKTRRQSLPLQLRCCSSARISSPPIPMESKSFRIRCSW